MTSGIDFRNIQWNSFAIPPMVKGKKGGFSCNPLYNDPATNTQGPLRIQTPVVKFPFGLSQNERDDGTLSYSLVGAFAGFRENDLMGQFYKFGKNMQAFVTDLAAANSPAWFGKQYTVDVCRALLNEWVKDPKPDKPYDPNFRMTVRCKDNTFFAKCYDQNRNLIDLSKIEPQSSGRCVIKLSSFYVINGKFGFVWDLERVQLTSTPYVLGFGMDEDMYNEEPVSTNAAADATTATGAQNEEALPALDQGVKRERDEPEAEEDAGAEEDAEAEPSADGAPKNTKQRRVRR